MEMRKFDWYSWCLGFVISIIVGILVISQYSTESGWELGGNSLKYCSSWFLFDSLSFYFVLLSGVLGCSLWLKVGKSLGKNSSWWIGVSVFSAMSCCVMNNFMLFWCFYELSILSLFLLLVVDSPYSERFLASWYLLGYVLFTSLPMMLCMVYVSMEMGSVSMGCWHLYSIFWSWGNWDIYLCLGVLSILFITKIPLPPFHPWLPMVHAEATSPVSVCLSGYVMKLGLLGLVRFCSFMLSDQVLKDIYMLVCFLAAFLFFLCSFQELDGKRWLAMLSLAHMVVAVVCLFVFSYGGGILCFYYSLGHGFSAGLLFFMLWWGYEIIGSRNWLMLSSGVSSSWLGLVMIVAGICSAASLPPSLQFFTEVKLFSFLGMLGGFVMWLFIVYLFIGSLIPFLLLAVMMSMRGVGSISSVSSYGCFYFAMLYLVTLGLLLFIIC